MDDSTLQRIQEVLQTGKTMAVAVGENPSIDDMGAALALFLTLQQMGKSVSVVSISEPIVELSNLVGIDKVKTTYTGEGADLVVSFPYREGEIEKVSYTIENDFLNIVVKAGEQGLNFSESDVKYTRGGGDGKIDVLFVVGVPKLSNIHSLFSSDALKSIKIVNIDNKQDNQGYGDIVLVSPRMSSVSEQMTQLLSDLRTPVDNDIAQNLLDGIMYATENFQSRKTSFLAFEMAGVLMRQGAIRQVGSSMVNVQKQEFGQKSINQPAMQNIQRNPQSQSDDQRNQFDQRKQQPRSQSGSYPQKQNQITQQRYQPQSQQPRPQRQPEPQKVEDNAEDVNPPTDWLTPKVYKGSSNV